MLTSSRLKGPDLAERKRRLLLGADAIVALPGGLGTLDELFEAACLKQIGMSTTVSPPPLIKITQVYACVNLRFKFRYNSSTPPFPFVE